ncbi:MAG TPA: transcriptional regulator [Verrucomicrobia bacterium]|nr:transcriptional regulator [Verrucomicrobiota bacterium]
MIHNRGNMVYGGDMGDQYAKRLKVVTLERAAHILRMLAHPQRLRLIEILERDQDAAVHALVAETGFPQAVVSQHLNQMRRMGLLVGQREGREMRYSISDPRALSILNCICINSTPDDFE